MNRLHPVEPATAEGKVKTLLDAVQASLGVTPNMFRLLANSPYFNIAMETEIDFPVVRTQRAKAA
jgi:hypothetical protein